jgi:hypothetical protein
VSKEDVISLLDSLESDLRKLLKSLSSIRGTVVSRKDVTDETQRVSRQWFENLEYGLLRFGLEPAMAAKYRRMFDKILELSLRGFMARDLPQDYLRDTERFQKGPSCAHNQGSWSSYRCRQSGSYHGELVTTGG